MIDAFIYWFGVASIALAALAVYALAAAWTIEKLLEVFELKIAFAKWWGARLSGKKAQEWESVP